MTSISSSVRSWLRIESLTVFGGSLVVWAALDGGWWRLLLVFLLPDVSMIGYLAGNRIGALAYNVAHTYALPIALGLAGGVLDDRALLLASSAWIAHIAFDRALGLGLKLPTGFRDTHLGRVGYDKPLTQLTRSPDATRVPIRTATGEFAIDRAVSQ